MRAPFLLRASYSTASTVSTRATSNVRAKLQHFIETGEIQQYTPRELQRRQQKSRSSVQHEANRSRLSPQKALLVIKSRYDSAMLVTKAGKKIDLATVKPGDLNVTSQRLREILEALLEVKKVTRKPINSNLLLALLGTSAEHLKDQFVVTKETLKLLERDQDTARAMLLCQIAGSTGVVGMNAVLEWCLAHGKIDDAFKSFHNRKKWRIKNNEQTYVLLFSGVAKAHAWGDISDEVAQKCIKIMENLDVLPSVEIFNACLSVLVKNFSNDQLLAWEYFDMLQNLAVAPDAQTFSIFLNGCKKYHQHQVEKIHKDMKTLREEKTRLYVAAQQKLVETADLVLSKVMERAIPPVPPTKQEALDDPAVLATYKKLTRKQLVDLDVVFASTYISCLINNKAGTGPSASLGSHYKFVEQGLRHLLEWCPDVRKMFDFAQVKDLNPCTEVRSKTDARLNKATTEISVAALPDGELNPMVQFPAPVFSKNKTKAIFSGKTKPLVDFGRPTFADTQRLLERRNYEQSGGKFGKRLPQSKSITMERKPSINRFLLQQALDGLLKLGKLREFYFAMHYALHQWGGIATNVVEDEIVGSDLQCAVAPEVYDLSGQSAYSPKVRTTAPPDETIIDLALIEGIIFKIEENFRSSEAPARFAAELLAVLTNEKFNVHRKLKPGHGAFNAIFSMLNRQVHLFNDINKHHGVVGARRRQVPDNTPARSLTEKQLLDTLDPLIVLLDCAAAVEARQFDHVRNRKSVMSNNYVDSFSRLISTLYQYTWTDAPENHPGALRVHRKIVKAGILLYSPKQFIDPREKITYDETILPSIQFVYRALKENSSLEPNDKKLMLALRSFFKLDKDTPRSHFTSLQQKIRALA